MKAKCTVVIKREGFDGGLERKGCVVRIDYIKRLSDGVRAGLLVETEEGEVLFGIPLSLSNTDATEQDVFQMVYNQPMLKDVLVTP